MKAKFFDINSVAIIWASETKWKIWNDLIKNLKDFSWEKYGVNPKWWGFDGIKFYEGISTLPITPDIAVIAIPARFVLDSLIECGEKSIKRVVIISAWFKEIWDIKSEEKIKEIAKKYDIRVLWPNCLGYIDTYKNLNLSFWSQNVQKCTKPTCNNISMISQSWAMAVAFADMANSFEMWFSKIISMWNKSDIDENDLLEELALDDNTKVIVIYLESIEKWRKFFELAKKITKKKPIVIVKAGISSKWEKAASSHTGALASSYDILKAAFEQSWVHMTNSLEEFFLWWKTLSRSVGLTIPEELVIITNAWWPWVMATDHSEFNGVKLASFSEEEKIILMKGLPETSSVSNPIDLIWDATSARYKQILENLKLLNRNFWILVMLTVQSVTDVENIAKIIVDFERSNLGIFIMSSFMWWESIKKARDILKEADVLDFDYPKSALISFRELVKQRKWQESLEEEENCISIPTKNKIIEIEKKLNSQEKLADNVLISEILESFKINYLKEVLVTSEGQIEGIIKSIDSDLLVARISSPDIAHKTDVWGVILNINGLEEAKKAYKDILKNIKNNSPDSMILGITFSSMLVKDDSTKEIFVWFKRDISFWDILIVGMWGIFVNIYEDVNRRLSSIWKMEIIEMFKKLNWYKILAWSRGQVWIDFESLAEIIFKLQFVFKTFKQIKEIDINPIFSDENKSIIIDAKFYL